MPTGSVAGVAMRGRRGVRAASRQFGRLARACMRMKWRLSSTDFPGTRLAGRRVMHSTNPVQPNTTQTQPHAARSRVLWPLRAVVLGSLLTAGTYVTIHPERSASADTHAGLDDSQILQVLHTANTGEVAQARLAEKRTTDARVKKLAAMMIADHTDADKKGADLARKDHLTLSDSPTSADLKTQSDRTMDDLRSKMGTDFDTAYIDAQVTQHEAVLGLLNDTLSPDATNQNVKDFLQSLQPVLNKHLQHAKDLQARLASR
jgi:putative membrane protein